MYQIELFRSVDEIAPELRHPLVERLDGIADRVWDRESPSWASDARLTHADTGLVLASHGDEAAGFCVYRRVPLLDGVLLYIGAVDIVPEHQGRHLLGQLCWTAFDAEQHAAGVATIHVAARTRSPIAWQAATKWLQPVVPRLDGTAGDAALLELAQSASRLLFPDGALDVPTMILRGAYAAVRRRAPPPLHDPATGAAVFHHLELAPDDALFIFGRLPRAAALTWIHRRETKKLESPRSTP
jgi:hypothetical protein